MEKTAFNAKKTFDVLGRGLMYRPTELGSGLRIPGGPLQGFLTSTAVGGLGGYGVGSLVNTWADDDQAAKRRRALKWAILGALATGVPAAIKSVGMASSSVPRQGSVSGLVDVQPAAETKAANVEWMPVGLVPAIDRVASDNQMTPFAKTLSINMLLDANQAQPGALSFGQLAKAGIGAGLGVLGGTLMARVLTDMLGLPQAGTRSFMQRGGGLGGALIGAGFVQ